MFFFCETNPEMPDRDFLRFGLTTTVAFIAVGEVHVATVQALPISILSYRASQLRWWNCVGNIEKNQLKVSWETQFESF